MGFTIRRSVEADWEKIRDIRLEMVADTPMGFIETTETALTHNEAHWRSNAARGSAATTCRFVAIDETGRWLGVMGGLVSQQGEPTLVGVYVTPDARGAEAGVSDALLTSVEEWARTKGDHLLLYVHEDNARARNYYEHRGFTYTGLTEPYPLDHTKVDYGMRKPLSSPA